MRNYNKKSHHLIYFLIISLLTSCSSTSFVLKPYQKSDIEITDNFSLEGKFKLSMSDSKETGYFFLKKTGNLIQINIGKNYILPEEKLLLDIRENLDINKQALLLDKQQGEFGNLFVSGLSGVAINTSNVFLCKNFLFFFCTFKF